MFSRRKTVYEQTNHYRLQVAVAGLLCIVVGAALIIWQAWAGSSYNPSVNGVCAGVDKCLEPIEESSFVARAIEPDPGQDVRRHEWDFLYSGNFGSQSNYLLTKNCDSNNCQQSCGDGHNDCSIVNYGYIQPSLFATANEKKIKAAMRGVDTEDAAGAPQERNVGVAIAYVGPDRGSSNLAVQNVSRSGFTVVWQDVTDVSPSKTGYNLHIEKLDNFGNPIGGQSLTIPIDNAKPFNEIYNYPFTTEPSSRYLVWVVPFYITRNNEIISRQSFIDDPIVGVEVNTPANSAPQLTFSTAPAINPPHYVLVTEQPFAVDITASDSDGDNVSLSIIGLPAGATFTNKNGPTPQQSTLTWTPAAATEGDYSLTVTGKDQFGATTQVALVLHVSSGNFAATSLFVNTAPPGAQAGLAADQGAVARVITDNLTNPNLVFSFKATSGGTDAIQTYSIRVGQSKEDVTNGVNLKWDSGWVNFATPLTIGSRSSDISYAGPVLAYDQDYYFSIKLKDIYDVESSLGWDYNIGHFKLRPTNYAPVLDPIPDQSVDIGNTLTITLHATDQDITEGVPQSLAYFVQGTSPSPRMALNSGTGVFTFTPNTSDLAGSPFTVTLCVRDSYITPAQACQTTHITVILNLVVPTGLSVSFTSPIQGTALWTHNSPGEDGFQLDRTSPAPARDNLVSTPANTTSGTFGFNDCTGTSTIDFRLRAYALVGATRQFSAAATASAVRPGFAPPTGLTATRLTANSARLSWAAATTGQTGYVVYRNGTEIGTPAPADTTFDVTGLTPGTTYVLSVRPHVTISSCSPSRVLGGQANLNWMQPNPNLSFTPNTLTFADQVINTDSAVQTIRVQNTGSMPLSITSSLTGTDAGSFQIVNSVTNYSLAVGAYWDAQIRFRPLTVGAKAAQFKVADASLGVEVLGNLQGIGVPPAPTNLTASWANLNSLSLNWNATTDPAGFEANLTGYSNNPVQDNIAGSVRTITFNIANCYNVTGTTHTVSLRAFSGSPRVYSSSISNNAGERPGWELPSPDPTFKWLANDSVRMNWTDPSTAGSQYEILVFEGATRRFNGTTTADATAFDITGLTPGTTYTVKMRPFRILPTCGSAIIWGAIKDLSYRQPRFELQTFLRGYNEVVTAVDLKAVPLGENLAVPLRIHNNGDPITISGTTNSVDGGIIINDPGGLFSSVWPAPFNNGADWNVDIRFSAAATTTNSEITLTIGLQAATYGQVFNLPIKLYPLFDLPANTLQVFTTNQSHNGDFENVPINNAQEEANAFCNGDTSLERDSNKEYKALLWFDNLTNPGVITADRLYKRPTGEFVFGVKPASSDLPFVAQAPLRTTNASVWSGRGMSRAAYNCNNWSSGGWGSVGSSNDSIMWSLSSGGGSNCSSQLKSIYCVEIPPVNGEYIIVSANIHNGNFAGDTSLGGSTWYEKANDFCQIDPATSDSSEWRALLYAGNINPLPQTVITGGRSYYNSNDQLLFSAATDNSVPITLSTPVEVVDNTVTTGFDSNSSSYCSYGGGGPWSSAVSVSGNNLALAHSNSNNWLFSGGASCNYSNHLYCIQQQVPAKRIIRSDLASGNGGFGANVLIPGATWDEKANYVCQNSSATGGTGTWKALLWADNALPQTVIHANTLYIRPDGHRLFRATSDNEIPMTLLYPPSTMVTLPATGYGDASKDCSNWTSFSSQFVAGNGTYTDSRWLNYAAYGCHSNVYFYCVEQ